MKEIKRTISVNVNGKKVDIRFFKDPELIEKVDIEEKTFCYFCKLNDLCNNGKLKNPFLLNDSDSDFHDFCISAGVTGRYNYNTRLFLDTVKKEFPELYESAAAHCKEVGINDISMYELEIVRDDDYFDLMPIYEDVEPILGDLKNE